MGSDTVTLKTRSLSLVMASNITGFEQFGFNLISGGGLQQNTRVVL